MSYPVRKVCDHPTLAAKRCRRTGRWALARGSRGQDVLCWQHATEVARNRNITELIHWITGERRTVPPGQVAVVDETVLPAGRDAIIRELNRVRTRRALSRARYALIVDLRSCLERGGLAPAVLDALRAAKARVGMNGGTTS